MCARPANSKKNRRRIGDDPARGGEPRAAPTAAPIPAGVRPHAYMLVVLFVVMLALFWMVTVGTGRLLYREDFAWFYDSQAKSLLHGRWDVPYEDITFEAFVRDGKYYEYFGVIPALMRLPMAALFPSRAGQWSRLSMLTAAALSLACTYGLLVRLREMFRPPAPPTRGTKIVYAGFVASAGLGSSLLFVCARSYVYHEAIIWGAAFALACYYCLVRYLADPAPRPLLGACAFGFLAFNTRTPVGGGAVLALLLLAANVAAARWRLPARRRFAGRSWAGRLRLLPGLPAALNRWDDPPPYRHALLAAAGAVLAVSAYAAVNYAKFRTFLNGSPMWMYNDDLIHPKPPETLGGGLLNVRNFPAGFYAYLAPDQIELHPYFPWVWPVHPKRGEPQIRQAFPSALYRYHGIQYYASLTASAPSLFVVAAAGLLAARRRFEGTGSCATIPVLGALAGGTVSFAAVGISQRYLHEFFPWLVLSGALGLNLALGLRRPEARRLVWLTAAPLAAWGLYANASLALLFQRRLEFGVPRDRQEQFIRWQQFMDQNVSSRLFDGPGD